MSPEIDAESVRAVAAKDFRDAIRSRLLLVVGALFVAVFLGAAFVFADGVGGQAQRQGVPLTSNSFLRSLTNVTRLFVPLTGAVVAYASLIGERESGTLKLLLSLPHSRLNVVLGKLLGRGAVLAGPVVLGLLVAVPTFPLAGVSFDAGTYALFVFLTVLVGLVFVAVGLGASAAADTGRQAVVGTFVPFAVFTLLWGQVAGQVASTVRNEFDLARRTLLEVYFGVRAVNPIAAYQMVASSLGSPRAQLTLFSPPSRQTYAQQYGSLPWYLTDAALVAVLLVWIAVPLALGYLAFERKDL